jgi:hypothetical protein
MSDDNPLQSYDPFHGGDPRSPIASPAGSGTADEDATIRALEQRLNIWESQLAVQEQQLALAQRTGVIEPPANWPSFYPIVHFDPQSVPDPLRQFTDRAMLGWALMAISFALNFLGCLSLLRAGDAADSPGSKIALSALYLFLIVPIALDLNALAIYRALKTGAPSRLTFMKIFIFLGAATIFQGILTIGFETSGSCGLVTMLNLFVESHPVIGIFALVITAALAASTYVHLALLKGLWNYWRGIEPNGEAHLLTETGQIITGAILSRLGTEGVSPYSP